MARLTAVLALLMVLGAPAGAAAQATVLEVVDLAYRNATEVIPVLQPLVGPEGSVSAIGNQLVIRATPRRMGEIRKVLAAVDKRPRRLVVTVGQDADFGRGQAGVEAAGKLDSGGASVTLPGKPGAAPPGAVVGTQGAGARVYNSQSASAERGGGSVQVLEGNSAFIATGTSAPVTRREAAVGPGGARLTESTRYVDAVTGFHVRPRTSGERVTVEISASGDRFVPRDQSGGNGFAPPGTVAVQRFDTVVSGRLGEWIALGGVSGGAQLDEQGSTWRSRDATRESRRWYIRVDALP